MPALRAIALVVVVSKPLVWNSVRADFTIRLRIASLFCARFPVGRFLVVRVRGGALVAFDLVAI
jgi:hypothetical protein